MQALVTVQIFTEGKGGDGAQLRYGGGDADAENAAVLLPAFLVLVRAQDEQVVFGWNPVRSDALEYPGSVVQCMRQDAHLRIAQRHVLTLEVNNQVWIGIGFHTATSLRDSRYNSRPRARARSSS